MCNRQFVVVCPKVPKLAQLVGDFQQRPWDGMGGRKVPELCVEIPTARSFLVADRLEDPTNRDGIKAGVELANSQRLI